MDLFFWRFVHHFLLTLISGSILEVVTIGAESPAVALEKGAVLVALAPG